MSIFGEDFTVYGIKVFLTTRVRPEDAFAFSMVYEPPEAPRISAVKVEGAESP